MSLTELMREQDGVACRAQVLATGDDDDLIESRIRRRRWARVHRGVYVDRTGRCHGPNSCGPRCCPTATPRRATSRPWHRVVGLAAEVHPSRLPPTMRLETRVLSTAARQRREASVVAILADACQSRRTTAHRLADRLTGLTRLPRRSFLLEVLEDVVTGAYSVLEHRYLIRVERPHGLPTAARQRRVVVGRRPAYRDVEYLGGALVVELDGRLGHDRTEDRWADLDRDIDNVVNGTANLRLGWGQVLDPCRAADVVGRMLAGVGWRGNPRRCGRGSTANTLS